MTGKNIAGSVRARLANHARQAKRPYQEVLQYGPVFSVRQ
jgi:hypothetical protein